MFRPKNIGSEGSRIQVKNKNKGVKWRAKRKGFIEFVELEGQDPLSTEQIDKAYDKAHDKVLGPLSEA